MLADLVAGMVSSHNKGRKKHPATRTFLALRIFINQELSALTQALHDSFDLLTFGGHLVVISFHSLEDRIVKQFMAARAKPQLPDYRLPVRAADLPQPEMSLVKKIKPSDEEVAHNPRARSAIMRIGVRDSVKDEEL